MFKITTILILGFFLRFYGIGWDQGFHLHPDERMLIMVADKIHLFNNLNPEFFNYGTLPIYLLKGLAKISNPFLSTDNYNGLLYLGRILSLFADTMVIYIIYLITQLIFKKQIVALLASLLYSVAFFPIQNAHFFIVDVFLNLFISVLIFLLLKYVLTQNYKLIVFIGIITAAALATKITSIILLPIIFLVLSLRDGHKFSLLSPQQILPKILMFIISTIIFHFLFMPYAYLSWKKFTNDVLFQTKMNSNPYIFPYTLQYVGTLPYIYHLKNIFLWGLGPIIGVIGGIGVIGMIREIGGIREVRAIGGKKILIVFFLFYLLYFLVIGNSSVKFMRYMLPLYPFFTILAGYGFYKLFTKYRIISFILLAGIFVWTLSFINIYSTKHTRIAATEWILKNISAGSTLAVEHWDDRLPLFEGRQYNFVEMTLYDQPDNDFKWNNLTQKLETADYLIIASNRLYIPLQRLKDCKVFKLCYPLTAEYYRKLFEEKLGFKKVAEFASYPTIPFTNIRINDNNADESFTVYDHPKIMIFKKVHTK